MADSKQDELDRMLDAALAKYATVEPRAGLEGRVLANLQAERDRVPNRAWWRGIVAVAGALAALVVVALALAWRAGKPSHPAVANQSSTAPEVSTTPIVTTGGGNQVPANQARPQERVAMRRAAAYHPQPKVVASNPKLDQFPSPRPLSEQEKILENYVTNYPEHAALIARARAQELRRDAAEEMNTGEAGSANGSQQ